MKSVSVLAVSVCTALLPVAPANAQKVGISAAVNQSARGIQPGSSVRTIVIGDNVVYNERIETDTVGLLQILLADGTTFTVGPNSALSIDRFVYDPAAGTAQVTASLTKGVFRFIGGKTSKTPDGVTLNTPVGTIGIRGAMVTMGFGGGTRGSGPVTSHIDMNFGEEVTLESPGGETQRIFKPGYSIIITKNADGSEKREVRRTPPGVTNEVQNQLSGAPGTRGGATNGPTDPLVIISGISTENSNRPPVENAPKPTGRPEQDSVQASQAQDVLQDATTDLARQNAIETAADLGITTPASGTPPTPGTTPLPVPTPTPRSTVVLLMTAGATYVTNSGDVISNPGSVGLIGGSDEEDRGATLVQPSGSPQAKATTNRGDLILPVFSDESFTIRNVPLDGSASLGGIPLGGVLYSGSGGFMAYALGLDGDPTRPVYVIGGTPVADYSVFGSGDLRRYSFSRDMLQNIDVPFTRADALGSDYSQASISDLFILEGDDQAAAPKSLQSWLLIDGVGASQRSGIGVNVGNLFLDDSDSAQLSFGRRGSFRANPVDASSQYSGTVATFGLFGENKFYGQNGEYFALSGADYDNDFYSDRSVYQSPNERFSTTHILNLTSETPASQYLVGETQSLANGGGRTIFGYANGLIEVGRPDGSYELVRGTNDAGGSQFFISFDDATNTLGGQIDIADSAQSTELNVAFGNGTAGNTVTGNSIYIDDNLFAATNNNNRNFNTVTRAGQATPYRQIRDNNPRTYLISGDVNPAPNLIPNGKLCDCDFLEWGWWGTQVTANNGSDPNDIRAGVHLGTWVAGDITTTQQLATVDTVQATFNGRALGTVSAQTAGGTANYIASGAMAMSYNFGSRTGSLAITNFDQRDFAASVTGTTGATSQAEGISGTLVQTNAAQPASGSLEGIFVNDGTRAAAGLMGEFNLSTPSQDWSAVGIVAGSRP